MAIRSKSCRETDYLFASARVRAAEARLIGREKLEAAISAKDKGEIEALCASLCEAGNGGDALSAYLTEAYAFIGSVSPDENIAAFLRYPYDCNNIKSAMKCHIRGEGTEGMLSEAGSVPLSKIKEMPKTQDFSALPESMALGAAEATAEYAKSLDPCLIDIILDKACYADMLRAAEKSGDPFSAELVKLKIDLTNLMMTLRSLRMGNEKDLLASSLIDGGDIIKDSLLSAFDGGEEAIASLFKERGFASLSSILSNKGGSTLSELEKECDDIYMQKARSTRFLPFGAPILVSYAVAVEYTVKNLRIILAGKRAGLAPEEIRRRVRLSYV